MVEASDGWVMPSIDQWLQAAAVRWPKATAVRTSDGAEALSFSQLAEVASETAASLSMVGPGDRVGLVMRRSPVTVRWLFAIWARHATVVPLGPTLGRRQRQQRREQVPLSATVDPGARDPLRPLDVHDAPRRSHRLDPVVPLILFTSGSTGVPKAVQITHRNLRAAAAANAARVDGGPDTVWYDPLPLEHMGGLMPIVRAPIYGMTTVIAARFTARRLSLRLQESGATAISVVPRMLRQWLRAADRVPASLDAVLVGGAPTPPALVRQAHDRGVPLYVTYGMTETTSQVATATPGMLEEDPTTVGPPLDGLDVRIVDQGGSPCPTGRSGNLIVRGPMLTPGYLDGDRSAFTDGWFRTGDIAVEGARGWLRIVGRGDRRILSGGETVDPQVTEEVIATVPGVSSVWVGGLSHDAWGEQVVAVVEVDGKLPEATLTSTLTTELDPAHRPRAIYVTESLPRTASGTVDGPAVIRSIADEEPTWHA